MQLEAAVPMADVPRNAVRQIVRLKDGNRIADDRESMWCFESLLGQFFRLRFAFWPKA